MKISSFLIDGFGIFRDQTVRDLPDGLVLFLGNNESGKSTALSFVRSILFGFPDGRSKENPYPPLAGGKHGGRLIISDSSGRDYTVERAPGKHGGAVTVILPDGTLSGSETLQQLLGAATKDLFKNIYAFSLEELQTLTSLNNESVRGAIYGASAGTGILALPGIETEIDKQTKALFLPGGQKPEINQLLSKLEANKKELLQAKSAIDEYDEGIKKLREVKNTLTIALKDEVTVETDLKKVESYLTLWEDWVTFCQAEKELSAIDIVAEFPQNGLVRLDRFIEKQNALRTRIDQKKNKVSTLQQEFDALPHEKRLLNKKGEIERLLQGRDRHVDLVESLPLKRQKIKGLGKEIEQLLAKLGVEWDEAKAAACDRSLFTRETIRNYEQRLDHVKTEKARCTTALESARNNNNRALDESNDIHVEDIAAEEVEIDKRKTALVKLRALLPAQSSLKDNIRHIEDRIADKKQQQEWLPAPPRIPGFLLSAHLPGALAILGILAGVLLIISDHIMWGVISFVIFLIIAGWLRRFGKQQNRDAADYQQRLSKITDAIDKLEEEKQGAEKSLNKTTEQIDDLISLLGVTVIDLDKIDSEIEERKRFLEKAKAAHSLKETTEKELEEAEKRFEESEARESELLSEWKQWLNSMGFSPDLSPQTALDALRIIDTIVDRITAKDAFSSEIKEDEHSITTYSETARSVLASCERDLPAAPDLPSAIDRVAADLRIAASALEQRRVIEKELHETKREEADLEKEYTITATTLTDLIRSGTAKDEDDFRRRGALYEKSTQLKEAVAQARNNILRISGRRDWESLHNTLLSSDKETLLKLKTELSQRRSELKEELESLRNKRADLEAAITQMSTADTISRLRATEERLLEELRIKAEDWSRLAISKHLLSEARKKFEQEQQPEVIREASIFFKTITGGRYQKIIAPPGEKHFEVIDNNSSRKGIDALSRGTQEQLYLCVRFGYIQNYASKQQPLPIIMDDILVNFDPMRARAASQAIYDLSRTHQVLFFTCHPESITIFQEVDSNIPTFRLENNSFVNF
jgi:uncharacterized protein YhaN